MSSIYCAVSTYVGESSCHVKAATFVMKSEMRIYPVIQLMVLDTSCTDNGGVSLKLENYYITNTSDMLLLS